MNSRMEQVLLAASKLAIDAEALAGNAGAGAAAMAIAIAALEYKIQTEGSEAEWQAYTALRDRLGAVAERNTSELIAEEKAVAS